MTKASLLLPTQNSYPISEKSPVPGLSPKAYLQINTSAENLPAGYEPWHCVFLSLGDFPTHHGEQIGDGKGAALHLFCMEHRLKCWGHHPAPLKSTKLAQKKTDSCCNWDVWGNANSMNDECSAYHVEIVCPVVHIHKLSSCYFFFQLNTALTMRNRSFRCMSNLPILSKQKTRFRLINKESIVAHSLKINTYTHTKQNKTKKHQQTCRVEI